MNNNEYREKLIDKLKVAKEIKSDKFHFYGLTHTYDSDKKRIVYVFAPYPYDTMNALIAYIQYECFEICQEYSLDQDEIIEVLEKLYECKKASDLEVISYQKIDIYLNWEQFCGVAEEIQSIEIFKRDGLAEILKPYIGSYLLSLA